MERIVIVGGGISGLVTAINTKKDNNQVTILERNSSCGKKILITGNGKCNYFNENQDISNYHTNSNIDLSKLINSDNTNQVISFYSKYGIIPKIKNGYYYPHSNQAITIQNMLINKCNYLGINIICNTYVKSIDKNNNKFNIITDNNNYKADKVVIACGSNAYPKLGSDGNGYNLLVKFNHNIIPVVPALTQLKALENVKSLSGIRCDSIIYLYENNVRIKKEIGEIQFTDYGLSGICSMQLSRFISYGLINNKKEEVVINLVPDIATTKEELINCLKNYNNFYIGNVLDTILNYNLTNYILNKCHIKGDTIISNLTKDEMDDLVSGLLNFRLTIVATNSFDKAQVCAGGLDLREINLETMESKLVDNLYVVGEILDVDGNCGGYNITFATLTGLLASRGINND